VSPAVRAGMVDMESNTTLVQSFPAHEAVPEGRGPFPPVVVFHDAFGLTVRMRGIVNRLAREGFYAIAPNFYALPSSFASVAPEFMRTMTVGGFERADEDAARERERTLTDARAEAIFRQAFRYVSGRSVARPQRCGALGFSMGGRLAFLAACAAPESVGSLVAFHPTGLGGGEALHPGQSDPLERAGSLDAPALFVYGRLDSSIRESERSRVRETLTELKKDFQIEEIPEAGRDFLFADDPNFRIRASRLAWEKTLALLKRASARAHAL